MNRNEISESEKCSCGWKMRLIWRIFRILIIYFAIIAVIVFNLRICCYTLSKNDNQSTIMNNFEDTEYYLRKLLGIKLCFSRITAILLYSLSILVMIPVCKCFNQLIHKIISRISISMFAGYLQMTRTFHKIFSIGLVIIAFIHGVTHVFNAYDFIKKYPEFPPEMNWARNDHDNIFRLLFSTPTGFSGFTMLFILLLLWITSTNSYRNRFYNGFWCIHHLFIAFYGLIYFHGIGGVFKEQTNIHLHVPECENFESYRNMTCIEPAVFQAPEKNLTWIWPAIGFSIYILDRIIRYLKRNVIELSVQDMKVLPGKAVKLIISIKKKRICCRPGQIFLMQCSNISMVEWHPFSVVNCPSKGNDSFEIVVAVRGDWTNDFYDLCTQRLDDEERGYHLLNKQQFTRLSIDGPFPSSMEAILSARKVVYIAAGIGITPFIGALNELIKYPLPQPSRILLVWIVKKVDYIKWFSDVIKKLHDKYWNENKPDRFEVQLYVTDAYSLDAIERCFKKDIKFFRQRIFKDKPNWYRLFEDLDYLYNKEAVSIFCSGPRKLCNEVNSECRKRNRMGYQYGFIKQNLN